MRQNEDSVFNPLMPTVAIWVQKLASCTRSG